MGKKMDFRVVDLFSGGGGLTLGFESAGFDVVVAFDNWQPAIDFYKANFQKHPIFKRNLSDDGVVNEIYSFKPDIVIGGPPCQDFSSAGKRDESLGRANLTVSYANIIRKTSPRFFVMENVDRAVKSRAFARARRIFRRAGYGLSVKILDASFCGVPQLRKRLFVIGERNGTDGFLDDLLDRSLSAKRLTLKEYFGKKLEVKYYYRHPRSYRRRGVFSVEEPSPTIRGVNRPIPDGYPGHPGDATPISASIRPLTTRERSMVQTFPRSFRLIGSKTDVEQIIGNAVPVKLAEYVALRLREYLLSSSRVKEARQSAYHPPKRQKEKQIISA